MRLNRGGNRAQSAHCSAIDAGEVIRSHEPVTTGDGPPGGHG
jgi:hypothetical protein